MTSESSYPADPNVRLGLSVFFPCHNEEGNVERVVSNALEVLPGISDDYEIIVVDDGSTDATGAIADRLAAEHEAVSVIHHEQNRGYGGALQSGFRAATKEWVFYTDGDGQFNLKDLPGLLGLTAQYDIVTCYRMDRQDPLGRKVSGWGWSKLVSLLFGLGLRDVDCAFKLYRREVFDNIEMHSEGALIDTEILARAKRRGYRMVQRGVHHYPRQAGVQSGASPRVVLRAVKELIRLRKQILKG